MNDSPIPQFITDVITHTGQILFWRMGHGRVVSALDTAVGGE